MKYLYVTLVPMLACEPQLLSEESCGGGLVAKELEVEYIGPPTLVVSGENTVTMQTRITVPPKCGGAEIHRLAFSAGLASLGTADWMLDLNVDAYPGALIASSDEGTQFLEPAMAVTAANDSANLRGWCDTYWGYPEDSIRGPYPCGAGLESIFLEEGESLDLYYTVSGLDRVPPGTLLAVGLNRFAWTDYPWDAPATDVYQELAYADQLVQVW